ncbi:transposase InsO family protein [Paucibacter oligotrophus]|uniref:Transposase InsO family protein n=1 Tax=Roseateles oligotrophus TaxID=1769250 RepID=A0A840LEE8_9BURK|nr:integrase [Roseateles oligotrophus]MBB4845012.1 transposase InsO family protein [Roseateles oligotrophus]
MALNAVTTQRLVAVAQAAAAAGPGGKGHIYAAACAELGISLATLHRHLNKVTMKPERKQRSDAGAVSLTRDEAKAISALLITSQRKNNKRLLSIGQAVEILRANSEVRAEFLDEATGELRPLSDSAIARALRVHGMHPDQLNRPTPAVELKSLHPNHVWQIDASLCVLYYLHAETEREAGLQVMERERFYKNKPANLKAIERDRVWSYEGTDHNSGGLMLNYVLGAESGTNLAESFIEFIQQRQVIHGVPLILMMDMGSANTSGLFKNLARRLQVKLIPHMPGNARATGQVENARNIIERSFEPALRLMPVADLAELNAQARRWSDWYNAHKVHSRHGRTRAEQWMTIQPAQLRLAPAPELCRELLTHEPESRKVSDTLTVQFKGREFDVRGVPGAMVGEKVLITFSPYASDTAAIVNVDAEGNELLHTIPLVARDDAGFREDGNVIGEDYRRPADTQLDTNRKEVERFAWDAQTDAEAEAKKKARAVPFGGRIDPYKPIEQAPERTFLPRRGTELRPAVVTQAAPARVLSHFEVAAELARRGTQLSAERHALIRAWHPDGVPEDQLDALADRLTVRAGLRVVAGGGA